MQSISICSPWLFPLNSVGTDKTLIQVALLQHSVTKLIELMKQEKKMQKCN